MKMNKSNYEKQAEYSRSEFLKWNQSKLIEKLGLEHDEAHLYISYIGQKYQISRLTGEVSHSGKGCDYAEKAEHNEVMPIYDFLCYSKENACLSHEFSPIQGLSQSATFGSTVSSMFKPYAERFSGRISALEDACKRLGGYKIYSKADMGYGFDIFPSFPAQLQFWECDDEFPAQIIIMMDKNLLDYIHFETAWFIASHLLHRLGELLDSQA
jgi:Domain of unknown function (DUF3786)